MTEQEIELCLERFATCKTTDVMNFDYAGTLAYLNRLKAENAVLHERLEKAVKDVAERIENALFCEFADDMTFKMASRIEEVIKAELKGGKE